MSSKESYPTAETLSLAALTRFTEHLESHLRLADATIEVAARVKSDVPGSVISEASLEATENSLAAVRKVLPTLQFLERRSEAFPAALESDLADFLKELPSRIEFLQSKSDQLGDSVYRMRVERPRGLAHSRYSPEDHCRLICETVNDIICRNDPNCLLQPCELGCDFGFPSQVAIE